MEGRRHGRDGRGVGDVEGWRARARRHVPTSGRHRRGAGGEGWESHRAGTLREQFHVQLVGGCDSSAGGNAEPRLGQLVMACHHCVPQHAAYEGVGATGCHGSAAYTRVVSILTCRHQVPPSLYVQYGNLEHTAATSMYTMYPGPLYTTVWLQSPHLVMAHLHAFGNTDVELASGLYPGHGFLWLPKYRETRGSHPESKEAYMT